ncbi:MAG: heparinase II/III family protein, partial [Acidobacteria bacterium]|nr:heparinase II/III family protein [Acidobacteriota bacterium]
YVTYAIDSAWEVSRIALAYDQVFDALGEDRELVSFLAARSRRHRLDNAKASVQDIQRNIETRILADVLHHPEKVRTNYPGSESVVAILHTVLEWPKNRSTVLGEIDGIVAKSTEVDGLSGEKGLNGYAIIAPVFLSTFLEMYARADQKLLPELLQRHPKLRQTYRFFLDTWCSRRYYPHTGDCGSFATRDLLYAGAPLPGGAAALLETPGLPVSGHSFFWRLYQATREPFYLQLSYYANNKRTDGLPYDLFAADPVAVQKDVRSVVARHGELPTPGSVNKQEWRIAILRSARDPDMGAVWLDYDSIPVGRLKNHYHYDAMNIGLYAKGLDLLPEFGYPAVQFGDWHTPQARWHSMTAAHNTVVVDQKNQAGGDSKTTLWADGDTFRAVRASSPGQANAAQYERTVAMVDLPGRDFYVLDVFRVSGGKDHAKFLRSHFSRLATEGLKLSPAPDFGHDTLMRNFRADPAPQAGWSAEWTAEDRRGYLPKGAEVRLRHTDLTRGAQAATAESWTVMNLTSTEELYVPTVMIRRQSEQEGLSSTFVGVMEPFNKTARLRSIRRLELETAEAGVAADSNVAVECVLAEGGKDLWIATDSANPPKQLTEKSNQVSLRGDMAFVRWNAGGAVERLAAAQAQSITAGDITVELRQPTPYVELAFRNGKATLLSGPASNVKQVLRNGKRIPLTP